MATTSHAVAPSSAMASTPAPPAAPSEAAPSTSSSAASFFQCCGPRASNGGGSKAKLAKPVAYFEAADFVRWVMDAKLVDSRGDAVILGSLVLKHGWIRSAVRSEGQVCLCVPQAWLVGWLVGCLVGWLIGWLVGWLVSLAH